MDVFIFKYNIALYSNNRNYVLTYANNQKYIHINYCWKQQGEPFFKKGFKAVSMREISRIVGYHGLSKHLQLLSL